MALEQLTSVPGNILVVDDTQENLEVLSALLELEGYEVRMAINGEMALMGVEAEPPDLILLDIMMPDLDGYEVCQRLKSHPKTKALPIIFISALDDVFDKVKAFQAGAVDYISKPFQAEEVLARVKNQLTIANLEKSLRQKNALLNKQNEQLHQIVEERRELVTSLQEMEEKSRQMFDQAIIGIYQRSPEGRYFKLNDALAQIYGYVSAQDWLDDPDVHQKLPYVDDQQWPRFLQMVDKQGFVKNLVGQVYRADGTQTRICESARPVISPEGQLLYYEGFVFEIPVK
ncbi:response regulator [Thermosynechococcaceae cyanobacterium BACA0444]|uniref:Response regulator n=1 Tax=Pseudocalidococcus azoricus BACA0444 TaxID=2918990 RepID=A0AAE4FQN5_9CYAN|nr:response regulator [Pseudocalidococcus azoricus]MDS3859517.1 response regulator [Pseudocalidococcus azoricus BACA0444]